MSSKGADRMPLAQRAERYISSAIATIQIRNVPERVHRVYQARAAEAGMSLQEYLLAELVRNAALRTPAELVAEVEARMQREGTDGFIRTSSAEVMRADRASH